MFCIVVGVVSNIMYFVILGSVLLVIFVVSIMIGSVGNFMLPFIIVILGYVSGLVFLMMVVMLLLL